MAEVKHKFTSGKGDGPDGTRVQPSNWNDTHDFTTSQTDVLLGRESSGAGSVEEIDCTSAGRSIIGTATLAAMFEAIKQAATDAAAGVVELATKAEAEAATDNERAMTPLRTKQVVDALNVMPAGAVIPYAGDSAPTNWLLCAGQDVSRTTYDGLFSAIGTTYGVGDGSTTFTLPDLRGRVAAGKDDMGGDAASRLTSGASGVDGSELGAAGGEETHQLTEAEMPSHTHEVNLGSDNSSSGSRIADQAIDTIKNTDLSQETGGDDPHNNVQPTLVLNYIIYAGV